MNQCAVAFPLPFVYWISLLHVVSLSLCGWALTRSGCVDTLIVNEPKEEQAIETDKVEFLFNCIQMDHDVL